MVRIFLFLFFFVIFFVVKALILATKKSVEIGKEAYQFAKEQVSDEKEIVLESFFRILAVLALKDGEIDAVEEITIYKTAESLFEVIEDTIPYSSRLAVRELIDVAAIKAIQEALNNSINVEREITKLQRASIATKHLLINFMVALYYLHKDYNQRKFLFYVGRRLGISEEEIKEKIKELEKEFNHYQKDPYEILGVSKYASMEEVKEAYRRLSKRYHPDTGNGDLEKMQEINWAYEEIKKEKEDDFFSRF
jgi:DnaJ-domain-containing protein 1